MSKAVAAQPIEYRDLIKEVYIDPIRTVVVIDDEFPSLDGMIAKELNENRPWNGTPDNATTVKEILQFCRDREKPWLVDVHDGNNIPFRGDEIIAPYLIHSDLMILDFNLNDTGEKAIKILRKLAGNKHFNMVIVYTNGDIEAVVRDIALGLTYADENLSLSSEENDTIQNLLGDWEVEDEYILDKLNDEITEQVYLNYRAQKENGCKYLLRQPEGRKIIDLHKKRPKGVMLKPIDIIKWLLLKKENDIKEKDKLSKEYLGHVSTASPEKNIKWIRTDCLFVTVVNKHHQPNTLPDKLLDALHEWCPKPHRLLMSQMRFLMDDRGVLAESEILENHYLQAGWLIKLLETKTHAQQQVINNTVSKHWEALGDVLRKDISKFADKLTLHLNTQDTADVIEKHCKIKINTEYLKTKDDTDVLEKQSKTNTDSELKKINKHINCYNSTKPVDGYHLTTGHILELDSGNTEKEYWICLSPACDLVPGQKTSGLFGRVKDSMPFTAVELTKIGEQKAIEEANRNIFLFLEIDKEIYTFTFHRNGDLNANAVWEQMIAVKLGTFDPKLKELQIWRPSQHPKNKRITMKNHTVRVVAQLQYQYALNLLQRFGATMSRVGLDFSN